MAKCTDCNGHGDKCLAGHSAHPRNWYDCETCKGTGKAPAFHPAWYTIKEGGTWLEYHGWDARYGYMLDQRSPTTVPMPGNKLVHSLMSKDKLVRWDCINGFRLQPIAEEALSGWEKDQLEEWGNCPCGGGDEECPDPKTGKPLCADGEPKKLVGEQDNEPR